MELTRSIVMVNWMHRNCTWLATVCVKSGVVEQRYVCLVTKCEKQNWLGRLKDISDCWPKSCGTMLILLPATHCNMHLHLILIWVLLIGQIAYKMGNKYIVAIGILLDKMMLDPCYTMSVVTIAVIQRELSLPDTLSRLKAALLDQSSGLVPSRFAYSVIISSAIPSLVIFSYKCR